MNRTEFKEWLDHFRLRFPATGEWMAGLATGTIAAWFEDVFATLELRDCLAVNVQLAKDGELAAYDRERIPSIFIRRAQEIAHERRRREQTRNPTADTEFIRRARERGLDPFSTIRSDRIMGQAFRTIQQSMSERRDRGVKLTQEIIHDLTEQAFADNYDADADDALDGPRYRCLRCFDTGFVSYRDNQGRPMCGHCECDAGIKKRDQLQWPSGKRIGPQSHGVVEWSVEE